MLLAPAHDRAHVDMVIDRIERAMVAPVTLPAGNMVASALSVGVAIYPDDGVSPQDLLRRADVRMYQRKTDRKIVSGEIAT